MAVPLIMKKSGLILMIILLSLPLPAIGEDSCRIRLKNGGELTVSRCWSEGDQVKFYFHGGIAGVRKDSVRKIEKILPEKVTHTRVIGGRGPITAPLRTGDRVSAESEEKADLRYYRGKKEQLDAELGRALERLREATDKGDAAAMGEARGAVKKISDAIYALTDEVAKKNGGTVPAGWWKSQ